MLDFPRLEEDPLYFTDCLVHQNRIYTDNNANVTDFDAIRPILEAVETIGKCLVTAYLVSQQSITA